MKRSKIVSIGILALSIASCHHRRHIHGAVGAYNNDPNYYVSSQDNGYYSPGYPGVPFWFYYNMMYHPYWGVYSSPSVAYYSRTTNHFHGASGWSVSQGGRTSRVGSFSRGGFGSSGRSVGA